MIAPVSDARRLWRMRRRDQHIDALLSVAGDAWLLTFERNGRAMLTWRYPAESSARDEADARRLALERAGWTSHW
jgi:hypothetical protein